MAVTIAPALEAFGRACLRLEPGTQNGGIEPGDPRQGGYHNSRDTLYALGKSGDYSLRYEWDRRGNSGRARAFDWTFPDAQGGDYSTIRRYMTRIRAAFDRRDPLLTGWREALGQQDADGNPEGFDFVAWSMRTPDMSHMWHIHFSIMNEFVDEPWAYNNMLSVLSGQTTEAKDVDANQNRMLDNADKYLWKLHALEPEIPINGNGETLNSELVPALVKAFDDIEEIRETVATLSAGGIDEAMLERVVRKVLGGVDGAVPPAS